MTTSAPPLPVQRTLWHVVYGGPQHGVMLRKLERAAGFRAIDPVVERLEWDGRQQAHVGFFVDHPQASSPEALHTALLQLSWRLAPTWRVSSVNGDLSAEWRNAPDWPLAHALPSGCWQVQWEYRTSQTYQRIRLLGGQAHRG